MGYLGGKTLASMMQRDCKLSGMDNKDTGPPSCSVGGVDVKKLDVCRPFPHEPSLVLTLAVIS